MNLEIKKYVGYLFNMLMCYDLRIDTFWYSMV